MVILYQIVKVRNSTTEKIDSCLFIKLIWKFFRNPVLNEFSSIKVWILIFKAAILNLDQKFQAPSTRSLESHLLFIRTSILCRKPNFSLKKKEKKNIAHFTKNYTALFSDWKFSSIPISELINAKSKINNWQIRCPVYFSLYELIKSSNLSYVFFKNENVLILSRRLVTIR